MNSNWSYSPETPNLGQIRRFLEPCDLEIWRMTLQNNRAPLLCYFKLCAVISYPLVNSHLSYSPETLNSGQNQRFFEPCDLEILRMNLKNNRASLLWYSTLFKTKETLNQSNCVVSILPGDSLTLTKWSFLAHSKFHTFTDWLDYSHI